MIKVEGVICACVPYVCASTWIQWKHIRKSFACFLSVKMLLSPHRRCISFHIYFLPLVYGSVMFCVLLLRLYMCVHLGGTRNMIRLRKRMSPSETTRAPGMQSVQKCSITPISCPHLDIPPLCFSWNTLFCFPPSVFYFSSFHFHSCCELHCIHWWLFIWSWWVFISASAEYALVKEKSFFHKYAYRYRAESTLMNAFSPSLPYIFLFTPASEVSECCYFSHPQRKLLAGCASKHQRRKTRGRGKKRRERKGRRTGHTGEKVEAGTGVERRARF